MYGTRLFKKIAKHALYMRAQYKFNCLKAIKIIFCFDIFWICKFWLGFSQNCIYFFRKICAISYFTYIFLRTFAYHLCMKRNSFCAIFRIIPHHTQQDLRKIICAKLFAQISKLRKKLHFAQIKNPSAWNLKLNKKS